MQTSGAPSESFDAAEFGMAIAALRGVAELEALISAAEPEALRAIGPMLDWFGIPAGTVLFEEGERGEDAYIVLQGRLGVLVSSDAGPDPVAQIEPGEFTGEMSLISREPRSATVVALRDCELVRIPRPAFELMMRTSPQLASLIMRQMASRLRRTSRARVLSQQIDSITLVFLTRTATLSTLKLAEDLALALAGLGRRVELHLPGIKTEPRRIGPPPGRPEAEAQPLILYSAGEDFDSWARRSIRQSDRVVFAAEAGRESDGHGSNGAGHPSVAYAAALRRAADLILINDASSRRGAGATPWLELFPPEHIIHIRRESAADLARVARLILRRAIGIVFSGGGARGFAHAGVVRALTEAGIPIDLAGGTSFGALVAAGVALDMTPQEIDDGLRNVFVPRSPFADYTLPIVALSRGRRLNRLLKQNFGETRIENLWKNFYCVSANLSTGSAVVHRSGLLRSAIRATCAVPGIVPPAVVNGEILVDGGIIDNFPTGTMAAHLRGPVIGVNITSAGAMRAGIKGDIEEKSLFWLLSRSRKEFPSMLKLLSRSGTVNGIGQLEASRRAADILIEPDVRSIDLLAWRSYREAIEEGYRAGVAAAAEVKKLTQLSVGVFET